MAKLPVLSGQEIVRLLSKAGFYVAGQHGSHMKLKKSAGGRMIVTIVPVHTEVDPGTLLSILRQSEITREKLFELMK